MATDQVKAGDWIYVDLDSELNCLLFTTEEENVQLQRMASIVGDGFQFPLSVAVGSVETDQLTLTAARSSKK
jgi:hypothetical protein